MRGRGGATRTKHAYTSLGATAVRVTLGPRGRSVVPVARPRFPMGDDITEPTTATPTLVDPLAEILANTRETLQRVKQDQENRKWALMIAGASALFAAVKLGFVAFPILRDRR